MTTEHAVYVEVVPEGFAVMQVARGYDPECVHVAKHALDAYEYAEKMVPPEATYTDRPDWCRPNFGLGAAYVW